MNKILPIILVVGLCIIPELSFPNDMHTRTGSSGGRLPDILVNIISLGIFFAILGKVWVEVAEHDGTGGWITLIGLIIFAVWFLGKIS